MSIVIDTQDKIALLDDLAQSAMAAIIAKSEFKTGHRELNDVYDMVARGAYSYALSMLDVRQQVLAHYVPQQTSETLNPVHDL